MHRNCFEARESESVSNLLLAAMTKALYVGREGRLRQVVHRMLRGGPQRKRLDFEWDCVACVLYDLVGVGRGGN